MKMSKRTLRLRETERKGRDKIHGAVSTACAVKGSEKELKGQRCLWREGSPGRFGL